MATTIDQLVTAAENACDVTEQYATENGVTLLTRVQAVAEVTSLQADLASARAQVSALQTKIANAQAALA